MDNKIKLDSLALEVTRRCNMNCPHCLRGNAQNITLSKEIIDRVFESVSNCNILLLTGGEPLLELDIIEYIVEKIIKNKWDVKEIQLVTNGSVRNERILQLLEKCAKTVWFKVSNDDFHESRDIQKTIDFYKATANKYCKHTEFDIAFDSEYYLAYKGRAVDYIKQHPNEFVPVGKRLVDCGYCENHRVRIENGMVICLLYIAANGNVGIGDDMTYDEFDKLAFGNITEADIVTRINNGNEKNLLLCTERDMIKDFESCYFAPQMSNFIKAAFINYSLILRRIVYLREFAKKEFSFVPAQTIIDLLPFPQYSITNKDVSIHLGLIFDLILRQSKYWNGIESPEEMMKDVSPKVIELFKKDINNGKHGRAYMEQWVNQLCINSILVSGEKLIGNPIFGTDEDVMTSDAFKQLSEINEQYRTGELEYDNQKVYRCDYDGT